MTSRPSRETSHCRNCGAHAPEEFCPRCGQETSEHLPSAWEFVHEFVLHYFAAEGRLWRTLGALVLHPGRLTVEYLKGRKFAYVLPLRLYLTISVVFFLIFKLATASQLHAVSAKFHELMNNGHSTFTITDIPHLTAQLNPDGSITCDMPDRICNRIKQQLSVPKPELERRLENLPTEMYGRLSSAMFVLLPLFACFLKLAFWKRTYGEHFLFALHVHSFYFLLLLLLLLPLPAWAQSSLLAYLVIYSVMALHAVYRSGWLRTALTALLVGAAYVMSLLAAMIVITLVAIMV